MTQEASEKFPLCVIALGGEANEAAVRRQFEGEKVELLFTENESDISEAVKKPECFAVFGSYALKTGLLKILHDRSPEMKRAFWVFGVGKIPAAESAALFAAGASDTLALPIPPATLKNRIVWLLNRFKQKYGGVGAIGAPDHGSVQFKDGAAGPNGKVLLDGRKLHRRGINGYEDPLLRAIDEACTEVNPVDWDEAIWPKGALPPRADAAAKGRRSKGLDEISSELRVLFAKTCEVLRAHRIILVSFQEPDPESFPDVFYSLISSGSEPMRNEKISRELLPQLCVALDRHKALYLDRPVPGDEVRAPAWLINGSKEGASAMLPLSIAGRTYALLFVQFDRACDPRFKALLGQAMSFLLQPEPDYKIADHLCRIYRRY